MIAIIGILVTPLFSCSLVVEYLEEHPRVTKIKEGFSYELTMWLSTEYGILIPLQEAEMIKGANIERFWADEVVIVLFKIPIDPDSVNEDSAKKYLSNKMNLDKGKWNVGHRECSFGETTEKMFGGKMPHYIPSKNVYASIHFKIEEGHYLIRIIAANPNGKYFS